MVAVAEISEHNKTSFSLSAFRLHSFAQRPMSVCGMVSFAEYWRDKSFLPFRGIISQTKDDTTYGHLFIAAILHKEKKWCLTPVTFRPDSDVSPVRSDEKFHRPERRTTDLPCGIATLYPLRHPDVVWRARKDVRFTTRHKSDQLQHKVLHDEVDLKLNTSRRTLGCGTRRTASRIDIRPESVLFAKKGDKHRYEQSRVCDIRFSHCSGAELAVS